MKGWELCFLALIGFALAQGPEKRRTGNVCAVDMDCPDNAFCRLSSYCVCKDGFVYAAINSTDKGCLKEARIGEECVQHIQCHSTTGIHSECANGICACASTAHFEDDRCYETAVIGERCVVDQNCYLGDQGPERQAFCVRGYCTCQLQFSPRDNGTRCVRDAVLGEECEDQLQCAGAGLECRGTCRCRDNWVAHNGTNSCVESVKELNDSCEYDVQCDGLAGLPDARSPGAALCLGGACACAYSARPAGTPLRCWHRRRPGQECRRDEECVSEENEPGYCLSGRCTCKNCSPDAKDFGGDATVSRPSIILSAILSVAAILRYQPSPQRFLTVGVNGTSGLAELVNEACSARRTLGDAAAYTRGFRAELVNPSQVHHCQIESPTQSQRASSGSTMKNGVQQQRNNAISLMMVRVARC